MAVKYEAPTVEIAEALIIYACNHSTCNGRTNVLFEADPDQPEWQNEPQRIYAEVC